MIYDTGRALVGGPANGIVKLVKNRGEDECLSPGKFFDCIAAPVVDGATGVAAGKTANRLYKNYKQNQARQAAQTENALKEEQMENLRKKITEQSMDDAEKVVKGMSQDAEQLRRKVEETRSRTSSAKRLNGHTACSMVDEEGNRSTGYSRRLCREFTMNRFIETTSKLQNSFPNISKVLNRTLDCCAEHMVFESLPSGNPIVTYAVQICNDVVKCVKRCDNCAHYSLDTVITDALHGEWIPSALEFVPESASYVGPIISGTIYITLENGKRHKQ